jgi:hypothetical protein
MSAFTYVLNCRSIFALQQAVFKIDVTACVSTRIVMPLGIRCLRGK